MMLAKFDNLKALNFDDHICDLAVMFDMYPTENDEQLKYVRKALLLIDELEDCAKHLPDLPRDPKVAKWEKE